MRMARNGGDGWVHSSLPESKRFLFCLYDSGHVEDGRFACISERSFVSGRCFYLLVLSAISHTQLSFSIFATFWSLTSSLAGDIQILGGHATKSISRSIG